MPKMPKRHHHNGILDIQFEVRRGHTRMPYVFQQPPLKASRELYEGKDPTATVYVMESSGGMVAGDRNDITIQLAAESRVRLIQQSALKVYPSHTGETCFQKIDVSVGENARLEWMPEVMIPFVDAKFQVDTTLSLTGSSTVLWGEIIAPGREKRGEVYAYESFRSNFKVYVDESLVAFDSLHFVPREMDLRRIGVLEDALYIGSVWLISPHVNRVDVRELQETLRIEEGLQAGITRLEGNAIHCRWLGQDQWTIQQEIKRIYARLAERV